MTQDTEPTTDRPSRRSILQKTATGGLVLAGTAFGSGLAAGQTGGVGFMYSGHAENIGDTPVTIQGETDYTIERPANCSGRGPDRTYRAYWVNNDEGDFGRLYVEPDRNIAVGTEVVLHNPRECGVAARFNHGDADGEISTTRVNFRPA